MPDQATQADPMWICSAPPKAWQATGTFDLASPDGSVQITAQLERLEPPVDLATYGTDHDSWLFSIIPTDACTGPEVVPLVSGVATRARIAAWLHDDGTPISTLVLTAVNDGWGVRCTASAPTATFGEHLAGMVEIVANLTFPFTDAVRHTAQTAAANDDNEASDRNEDIDDRGPGEGREVVQHTFSAPGQD